MQSLKQKPCTQTPLITQITEGPLTTILQFTGFSLPSFCKKINSLKIHILLKLLKELKAGNIFPTIITKLDRILTEGDLSANIHGIFTRVQFFVKQSLSSDQYQLILSQHPLHSLNRYIALETQTINNQNHAITVLATVLRREIPEIPEDPNAIRAWFSNCDNQHALKKIHSLDMKNRELQCIPEEIKFLPKLINLFLGSNNISVLPDIFQYLPDLLTLDLSFNSLTYLPPSFVTLVNLTSLWLDNNQFTNYPLEIIKFINLTILHLEHNKLADVPRDLNLLVSLKQLYLSCNKITNPEVISFLKNLNLPTLNINAQGTNTPSILKL